MIALPSHSNPHPPFLAWLLALAPGRVEEHATLFRVEHQTGDYSTLWKRTARASPFPVLERLVIYTDFDAADLFGSTFKVCSLFDTKYHGTVPIVGTVSELALDLTEAGLSFPEACTPFMSGTQWEYALAHASGAVLEYDVELNEFSGSFPSLEQIIEDWFRVVHP